MYYLSAKFQVNNTSQSEDTVGGPFGPPPPPASESPQKPSLIRVKGEHLLRNSQKNVCAII